MSFADSEVATSLLKILFFVFAMYFMIVFLEDRARLKVLTFDCQKAHPDKMVKVIEGQCFYFSEFGWILTSKSVIPAERLRGSRL